MRTQKPGRAQMVEAIMFFNEQGITTEMLYSEFEVILENMVCIPKFSDQQVRCAYVLISPRLFVRSVVLFYLDFDKKGAVEEGWNLALRYLAEKASSGPDLGGGPIRLACRSQSSIPWYQMHLWDPDLSPEHNHLYMIRDAVRKNSLHLVVEEDEQPVVEPLRLQVAQEEQWQQKGHEELLRQAREQEREQRHKAAQLIKQQRLRISTLEAQHTEVLAKLRLQAEQDLAQKDKIEKRLCQQLQQQQKQNENLKKKLFEQVERLKEARKDVQRYLKDLTEKESHKVDLLKAQYENELHASVETAVLEHKEQLTTLEGELIHKQEQIQKAQLEQERLQRALQNLGGQTGEQILQRLANAGVSLVTVHPGAGHFTIPLQDVESYLNSPTAYAAKRCMVSEEHYRIWLTHYENATCDALIEVSNTVCGLPLERRNHPSNFTAGVSNRCSRHRQFVR